MKYNKHQFKKINDKKVLHKVGKQWKTVSVALLMALGGTVVATHVSHASANTNNNQNSNTNQVTNNQSNHQQVTLVNTPKVDTANNNDTSKQSSNVNSQNITQQANDLHKDILLNSLNKQGQNSEASVSSKSRVSSSALSNVNQSTSSATNEVSLKANNVCDQQNSNNNVSYGTYAGMNYKYNKKNKSVEFVSGTMKNGTKFHNGSDIEVTINNVPNIISSAHTIKFDDDINTNNITDASYMFYFDSDLKSLSLSKGFGKNITDAHDMFHNTNLQSLSLPKGFGKNITDAFDMFSETNLQSLFLPESFGQHITNAFGMFSDNYNLRLLRLPRGFGNKDVITSYDLYYMFKGDNNLYSRHSNGYTSCVPMNELYNGNSLNLSSLSGTWVSQRKVLPGIIYGKYAGMNYKYSKSNNSIEFTSGIMKNGTKFDNTNDSYGTNIHGVPGIVSFANIMKFDSDVNTNNVTDASKMFYESNLKSLSLPSGFGKNITDADSMFANNDLHSLSLPSGFGKNITDADSMFTDNNLYSLSLPSGFGKNITNANSMFASSYYLQSLSLPSGFGKNIIDAGSMFAYSNLQSFSFPQCFGKNIINADSMFEGYDYFGGDFGSDNLTLPSSFGKNITDANSMFSSDDNLQSLKLLQGFGRRIIDANSMFKGDGSLQLLVLPQDFGKNISSDTNMFNNVPYLYLKDNNDKYTSSNPMLMNGSELYCYYDNVTPENPHDIAGTWVAKRNPKPKENYYNQIYNDSYTAYYDSSALNDDISTVRLNNLYSDQEIIDSARSEIATDFSYSTDRSAYSNANSEASSATSALNNANSLVQSNSNNINNTASYSASVSKNYNAIYDAYAANTYNSSAAKSYANDTDIITNMTAIRTINSDEHALNSIANDINYDLSSPNQSEVDDAYSKWGMTNSIASNVYSTAYSASYSASVNANKYY